MKSGNTTFRQALRRATNEAHEALDGRIGGLDLVDPAAYAEFLAIQLCARKPIERWVAKCAPGALRPPSQLSLIEADLAQLGRSGEMPVAVEFEAPAMGAAGVAWAIGGSSMGNRLMLARVSQSGSGLPASFLGDPAMPAFFSASRSMLDRPQAECPDLAASILAAQSVFATFQRAASAIHPQLEAAA